MSINIETQVLNADSNAIELGARIIADGGLVVFPTETVYGIGANALDTNAVSKIFKAKGRPQDNPLIVHISSINDMDKLVSEIPENAKKLAEKFWPGPLTMIMKKSDIIPENISAGLDTVAIRLPSHPIAKELIEKSGVPIAAPSANISGRPSPTSAEHCTFDLMGKVDLILDGGHCEVGLESTVVSLIGDIPVLLRPGKITPEQIREVTGDIIITPGVFKEVDSNEKSPSPGLKHKHYAPKADVILIHGSIEKFSKFCEENYSKNVWAMAFEEDMNNLNIPAVSYGKLSDSDEQASNIFALLRELDKKNAKTIYVHAPSSKGVGLAVYNRLLRAASFKEKHL